MFFHKHVVFNMKLHGHIKYNTYSIIYNICHILYIVDIHIYYIYYIQYNIHTYILYTITLYIIYYTNSIYNIIIYIILILYKKHHASLKRHNLPSEETWGQLLIFRSLRVSLLLATRIFNEGSSTGVSSILMDDNDFELTKTTVSADTKWDLHGNKKKIMKMLFKNLHHQSNSSLKPYQHILTIT